MRVRLQRDDGSFYESADVPEQVARELHAAYLQAIVRQHEQLNPSVVVTVSATYGLPPAWLVGQITGVAVLD